jgi:hypothetical protein
VFISSSAAENNMARPLHYQADECLIESISIDEIVKIIDNSIDSRLQSDRKHILAIGDLLLNKVSYRLRLIDSAVLGILPGNRSC